MAGRVVLAATGAYRDVELWCHDCRGLVVVTGWEDTQKAVHVPASAWAGHRELHAKGRAA